MPPPAASSALGAGNRARPRGRSSSRAGLDRIARVAFCLAVLITCLYVVESGIGILSARDQRSEQAARVRALEVEHARLLAERKALAAPDGISTQARRLGMVLPGEVPYVVTGLPGDRH